jgi:hypothetical protein
MARNLTPSEIRAQARLIARLARYRIDQHEARKRYDKPLEPPDLVEDMMLSVEGVPLSVAAAADSVSDGAITRFFKRIRRWFNEN